MQLDTFISVEEIVIYSNSTEKMGCVGLIERYIYMVYSFWLITGILKGDFPYTYSIFLLSTNSPQLLMGFNLWLFDFTKKSVF